MLNRTMRVVCVALGITLAGAALAASPQECRQLRGKGAGSTEIPANPVVLKLFECAGMDKDIEALDALDRDMMVILANSLPLKKFREQQTKTDPPRKYSELTSAARLAKFKQLVNAYYMHGTRKIPRGCATDCCPAGCVMMRCPPPVGPMRCCHPAAPYAPC